MDNSKPPNPSQNDRPDSSTNDDTRSYDHVEEVQIKIKQSEAAEPPVTTLPTVNAFGNPFRGAFCPFEFVRNLPFKYLEAHKGHKDVVHQSFFTNANFYSRNWDLCYVFPPVDISGRAILLLPLGQVQGLFRSINSKFKTKLAVPGFPFTWSFFDDGTPQPVYLSQVNSKDEVDHFRDQLTKELPGRYHGICSLSDSWNTISSFESFTANCRIVLDAYKPAKKDKSASRQLAADIRHQNNGLALRLIQQHFGLRPSNPAVLEPAEMGLPNLDWETEQRMRDALILQNTPLPLLQFSQAMQNPFLQDPLIVCIDVEVYEMDHSIITEIGIALLDTRWIRGVEPGGKGARWIHHIVTHHLRIKGTEHLINKKYCPGNPDGFNFGASRFVTLPEAADIVDGYFDGRMSELSRRSYDSQPLNITHGIKMRGPYFTDQHVILVGHNIASDIGFMQRLQCKTFNADRKVTISGNALGTPNQPFTTYDTGLLYQRLNDEPHVRSLGAVLNAFDILAQGLHNAGNDARYTLEVFIRIALEVRVRDTGKGAYDDIEGMPKKW